MAYVKRSFTLAEPEQQFIDRQVAGGHHASDSEVVQEALRRYRVEVEADVGGGLTLEELTTQGERDFAQGAFTVVRDAAHLDEILDQASERADELLRARRRGRHAA